MASMEIVLDSMHTDDSATFGELSIDGKMECYTLEDAIREIPGVPVEQWKIKNCTAIPAGRYRVTLERSARFGPDTLTLNNVPGFSFIRMHGGNDVDDTEGCILVGDKIDLKNKQISGAAVRGVLNRLKTKVRVAILQGNEVWITVNRPK